MEPPAPDPVDAQRELAYYRAQLDELSGQVVRADSIVSRAKRELRARREALSLLSELQRAVRADMTPEEVYRNTLAAAAKLKLDRIVLLIAEEKGTTLRPVAMSGYDPAAGAVLRTRAIEFPAALMKGASSLLLTAAAPVDEFGERLRSELAIPFLICVPVVCDGAVIGQLVGGRLREAKPFSPPLDEGDVSTLASIAGFLGSALHNSALFARVRRMADSFAKFVPREFLKFLSRSDIVEVQLGDQAAMGMTILFSDIRSFTTISERMTPAQTFAFINEYLRFAGPVIRENGGFIDKYIGDAIMALFSQSSADAVRAGIGLQRAVQRFNAVQAMRSRPPIAVGAGLHYGQLMLGTIGFDQRMESTVISDAVNLASRVEGLTKIYGAGVLVTDAVMASVSGHEQLLHRLVDRVRVKGKSVGVELYDVFEADDESSRKLKAETLPPFAEAIEAFRRGEFEPAAAGFERVLQANPQDRAAKLQHERCAEFLRNGPPADWDGTVGLDHK